MTVRQRAGRIDERGTRHNSNTPALRRDAPRARPRWPGSNYVRPAPPPAPLPGTGTTTRPRRFPRPAAARAGHAKIAQPPVQGFSQRRGRRRAGAARRRHRYTATPARRPPRTVARLPQVGDGAPGRRGWFPARRRRRPPATGPSPFRAARSKTRNSRTNPTMRRQAAVRVVRVSRLRQSPGGRRAIRAPAAQTGPRRTTVGDFAPLVGR